MIIDSKGKLFGKFSVIDLIIIIIVLAGVFTLVIKFSNKDTAEELLNPDKIEMVVQVYDIRNMEYLKLKNDGNMINQKTKANLGMVTDIKKGNAIDYVPDYDKNEWVMAVKPDYCSVIITSVAEGKYSKNNGVIIDGDRYFINKPLQINMSNSLMQARVIDLKKIEE